MAFRLRRGTDLQRQSIIFTEGELVYITDTKELYAGDGTTLGGVLITGNIEGSPAALTRNLDLDGYNISGSGTITATAFVGDGSGLTNLNIDAGSGIVEGQEYAIDIRGDVRGSDSSTIVDAATNSVYANFVGDGSLITDLTLDQLDDVATFSPGEGEVLKYISGFWTNAPENAGSGGTGIIDGQQYTISIQGDVVNQDSTVIVDATNNTFTGDLTGDVLGDLTGDVIGNLTGDVTGDVNGNVDAITVTTSNLTPSSFAIDIAAASGETEVTVRSDENRSNLKLFRESTTTISGDVQYGSVIFGRNDTGGEIGTGLVTGTRDYIYIAQNANGVALDSSNYISWNGTNLGIGTFAGTAKVEVKDGSIRLNDSRLLASISSPLEGEIKYETADGSIYYNNGTDWSQIIATNTTTNRAAVPGSLVLDNTTAYTSIGSPTTGEFIFDGVTGDGNLYIYTGSQWIKIVAEQLTAGATVLSTPLILGQLSQAEVDGLGQDSTSYTGLTAYNSDADRFTFYQAGSWVNLPNNGTAIGEVLKWNGTEWVAGQETGTPPTASNSDLLDGFDGTFYLDYTNFTNTPTISAFGLTLIDDADAATARTTLGLGTAATTAATAYATAAQGSTADTALQPANLGNFTFTGSVLDTDDSSAITVTPAVTISSDLTVENNLTVTNKITVDTLEVANLITTPSAGTPEISSDGAILLTAGTRVEVSSSPLKLASFTTTQRDLLSAENGDMIYNTTLNKFQGYENGAWVNLV